MKATIFSGTVFLATMMLATSTAQAAGWRTCNGHPIKWRSTLNIIRNGCSIGDTGDANAAYWNGVKQWADLMPMVINYYVNASCDPIVQGNGRSEVLRTLRSNIDGSNGVAISHHSPCSNSNSISSKIEVDIAIASDLPQTNPSPVTLGNEGRGTFVHEFGHLFGFLHDDWAGAMHQPPRPYAGGGQAATVWATDAMGIRALYGLKSNLPNLIASAYTNFGSRIELLETGTPKACRGTSHTVRFTIENTGNNSTGTYYGRIRLTTSASGAGGTTVHTFTRSTPGMSTGTPPFTFVVPTSLPNGLYYIWIDLDYPGAITEIRKSDNSTRSGQMLNVNC